MKRKICILLAVILVVGALVGAFFAGRATVEPKLIGRTFYATIEEIRKIENGKTEEASILVRGLEINDINHRSSYRGTITKDTKLTWRYTDMTVDELKVGQLVAVTYTGGRRPSFPGQLVEVVMIELLDDAK